MDSKAFDLAIVDISTPLRQFFRRRVSNSIVADNVRWCSIAVAKQDVRARQRGMSTSTFGVNHRSPNSPRSGTTKAVSARLFSAAMACRISLGSHCDKMTTAAGFPPNKWPVKASTWKIGSSIKLLSGVKPPNVQAQHNRWHRTRACNHSGVTPIRCKSATHSGCCLQRFVRRPDL
jgi:hypothetical protein